MTYRIIYFESSTNHSSRNVECLARQLKFKNSNCYNVRSSGSESKIPKIQKNKKPVFFVFFFKEKKINILNKLISNQAFIF